MAPGATSNREVPCWQDTAMVPEWEIAVLKKQYPEHWRWVPDLCTRVERFCRTYDSDADGRLIGQAIHAHFLSDDPHMLGIVMIASGVMIAHLLVSIDRWMGCTVCTVLQYEHDTGTLPIPRATLQSVFAWVQAWGLEHGAVRLQCLVREPTLVKTFAAFYHFRPFSMIMTRRTDTQEAL